MALPPRTSRSGATSRRVLSVVAVGSLGVGVLAALPASADAATARVSYPTSQPAFAKTAPDLGAAASKRVLPGELYLNLPDPAGVREFAANVSTPGSAQYGQYLSPSDWIDRFSPSTAAFQKVKRYVQQNGGTIVAAPKSRLYVYFTVPADSTTAAFGTAVHNYRFHGKTVAASAAAPSLPASIAKYVSAIDLGTARAAFTAPTNVRQGAGTGEAAPSAAKPNAIGGLNPSCSQYYGQVTRTTPPAYGHTQYATNICGYEPSQLRSAGMVNHQINNGRDGSGQTIAIVDAYDSPSIVSDTNTYMAATASPLLTKYTDISPSPSKFILKGLCQQPSGWQGEQAIDVQSAHSIAPGASILYSGGTDCYGGLDAALSKILDNGLADIVSNSYGNAGEAVGDATIMGEENIHLQAAGEGIGLYFSSGDDGDDSVDFGQPAVDYPASSPWVTAVGGTDEAINKDGSYGWETGWESLLDQIVGGNPTRFTAPLPGSLYGGGAGGGVSSVFAEPDYQKGVVPDSLAMQNGAAARVVPDIADLGDPYTGFEIAVSPIIDDRTLETGSLIYETYGGTSLAAPIAAAKMALTQDATGLRLGFANPALYGAAANDPSAFHDVSAPPDGGQALYYHSARSGHRFLVTLNDGFSIKAGPGYDTVTGVGSLIEPELASYLGSTLSS